MFNDERFSSVLVQGDTDSTLGASLAAYGVKIPIYQVKAGCYLLRYKINDYCLNLVQKKDRILHGYNK
jgi:UDP-N-acetylglucosamine 2-epimerase